LSKIRRKIKSSLFEITEPFDGFFSQRTAKFPLALELLSFTERVDENVSYDLITTKRCDDLLGSCDFTQIWFQFQNFIFSRVEPKVSWSDLVEIRLRVCIIDGHGSVRSFSKKSRFRFGSVRFDSYQNG
jgi:hypothetical protein